jgi:hypothetical protein
MPRRAISITIDGDEMKVAEVVGGLPGVDRPLLGGE